MKTTIKLFSMVTLMWATPMISQAQEVSLVGGMNFSSLLIRDDDEVITDEPEVKSRFGGHVGALVDVKISGGLSLETGLLLSTKGNRFKEKEDGDKYLVRANIAYLELPITAKYGFTIKEKFKVYGIAGPVLGFALRGVYKDIAIEDGEKDFEGYNLSIGNDPTDDDIKRLDFGIMVGAGVQYDRFRLGMFYNHGLMNISPFDENGYREKNRAFGISFGYVLNKK
jgi:hypothetical protein